MADRPAHQWWLSVAVVWAVGLASRLAYTLAVKPQVPGLSDATTYHLTANLLASGHGLIRPYDFYIGHVIHPTAEFPPLFPFTLAAGSWFGATSVTSQRIFTCILGSLTVIVVACLGRRINGRTTGLIAAAIAAVHPLLIGSDAVAMSETLDALVVAVVLLVALRAISVPGSRRWALLGVLLGATVLTRGENLLLVAVVAVPVAVLSRRRMGIALGIIAVSALVVVLPWTIRNALTFKSFVPIADDSGGAISGANCPPAYYGAQAGLWLYSCNVPVDVHGLDEAQASARYRHLGLTYVQSQLRSVPRIVVIRVLRTWGLYRAGQQVDYETLEGRTRWFQRDGQILDWLLYVPAAIGTVSLFRRNRAVTVVLLAPILVTTVTAAFTYGNERFREPAEAVLVILAVVGFGCVGRRLRGDHSGDVRGR